MKNAVDKVAFTAELVDWKVQWTKEHLMQNLSNEKCSGQSNLTAELVEW